MIIYILHLSGKYNISIIYNKKRKLRELEVGTMWQDLYTFGIHIERIVFKVERKLSAPKRAHNRKFLGLTTLVTFELPVCLPMNTRRCSKTSLRVTDV